MNELAKQEFLGDLYAYYGQLLTPNQQNYFEDYYYDDLSLGEIAQNHQVSRAAVYDNLKRSSKLLENYENKLHLQAMIQELGQGIEDSLKYLNQNDMAKTKKELELLLTKINHN
jgi:predicted DNA-binding protein YlxM (UPF0122 family)